MQFLIIHLTTDVRDHLTIPDYFKGLRDTAFEYCHDTQDQISISLFAKYVNISTATILVNSPDIDKRRFSINKHQQCGYK